MSDPATLNSQAERIAAAKRAQEQRENGIRAQAIKQGREAERSDMLKALGVQALEEASTSAQLRAERDARHTHAEFEHARRAAWWRGACLGGLIIGSAMLTGAALYTNAIIAPTFDAAAEARMQQGVVDTLSRATDGR